MSPSVRPGEGAPVRFPLRITCDHGVDATVSLTDPDEVRVAVEVTAGHLPVAARSELVEAVFELPEVRHRHRVRATVPLGDSELLEAFARHCPNLRTRAAGASCLVDAQR